MRYAINVLDTDVAGFQSTVLSAMVSYSAIVPCMLIAEPSFAWGLSGARPVARARFDSRDGAAVSPGALSHVFDAIILNT